MFWRPVTYDLIYRLKYVLLFTLSHKHKLIFINLFDTVNLPTTQGANGALNSFENLKGDSFTQSILARISDETKNKSDATLSDKCLLF